MSLRPVARQLLSAIMLWLASMAAVALEMPLVPPPAADPSPPQSATLNWMSRDIAVFRGSLATLTPAERVARAKKQLEDIDTRHYALPVTQVPFQFGNVSGVALRLGDHQLFFLVPADVDPLGNATLEQTSSQVTAELEEALAAWRALKDPEMLARGLLLSIGSLALLAVTVWLLMRLRRWAAGRVKSALLRLLPAGEGFLASVSHLVDRIVQLLIVAIIAGLIYIWLVFALEQFPASAPIGEQLGAFLTDIVARIGDGAIASVPSLLTLAVILFITRAVADSVNALFHAAQEGSIVLPGLHRDTMSASRRMSLVLVWALGFTFAYPYIPGSQSAVFQGLSVLIGFMITLGSTGISSHLMSGMTLIYSRALRRGDLVQIGDTIGVVQEVGALSTKLVNLYNEEITIPNTIMVSNPIRNLSGGENGPGVSTSTKVTIGYDAPWRQVHALLLDAAAATPGLKREPAPFVLQRALSDFYVEYELVAAQDNPLDRLRVLSVLHANIQDAFNAAGVQIMSPNFESQPDKPVFSPKEQWYAPPARPDAKP